MQPYHVDVCAGVPGVIGRHNAVGVTEMVHAAKLVTGDTFSAGDSVRTNKAPSDTTYRWSLVKEIRRLPTSLRKLNQLMASTRSNGRRYAS